MITLEANDVTTREIIAIVQKTGIFAGNTFAICWQTNGTVLFYNPTITVGNKVGTLVPIPPTQTKASMLRDFAPNYLVIGGTNGFAAAANSAGLFSWNGTSTQADSQGVRRLADDLAAELIISGGSVS